MNYYFNSHNRQSIRLPGYDYSLAGVYFVTICTKHGTCIFGQIVNDEMLLNNAGRIADEYLKVIPTKYSQTKIHEYVIMPNHLHVIMEITKSPTVGAIHESPLHESQLLELPLGLSLRDQRRKMLLPKIVGWYKMNTAKHINIIRKMPAEVLWQRNYYEHIIRNNKSYHTISNYITNNPSNWNEDKFFNPLS